MSIFRIIYYVVLAISLILSLVLKKKEKGLMVFPFLFSISLITDVLTYVLSIHEVSYYAVYHIYILFEYVLLTYYFISVNNRKPIKKIMGYSIPVVGISSLLISFTYVKFHEFPSIQINIQGLLLILMAIYTIFNIEINIKIGITSRPVFWICFAVMIYYSYISPFIGIRKHVIESINHLSEDLHVFLIYIPNYVLYTLLSIAFICSQRIKT